MAELTGSLTDTFTAEAPVDATRAHFADLDAIAAATDALDHADKLGEGKLRMVLQEQNHGVHKVTPSYVVQYRREGDDVVWHTLEGNMRSEGRASFSALGSDRTQIRYSHTITLEMPVGRLVAKVLQPVVKRMVEPSIRDYVQQLLTSLKDSRS